MSRRYSEQEIDEAVLVSQDRRLDERMADPSWQMIEDDLTPILGGGVWRRVVEAPIMATITFSEIHQRVAAHQRAEAVRNAPAAVAQRALDALTEALDLLTTIERDDVRRELLALVADIDMSGWGAFGAALASRED